MALKSAPAPGAVASMIRSAIVFIAISSPALEAAALALGTGRSSWRDAPISATRPCRRPPRIAAPSLSDNSGLGPFLLHRRPTFDLLLSSDSASEVDGAEKPVAGNKNANDAPSRASAASAAPTATKTAEVTRMKSKKSNISGSIDNGAVESSTPFSRDDSTTISSSSNYIHGLQSDKSLDIQSRVHCTLTLLRKHLPTLLEQPPISPSTASWVYEKDVTVTGPGGEREVLAEGIEEVVLLNRALAAAATAARRAGSLLELAVGGGDRGGGGAGGRPSTSGVECELLVDPDDPLTVLVLWRARLPSIGGVVGQQSSSSSSTPLYTEFAGTSVMTLSSSSGLVTNLQIRDVGVNGVPINEPLGTALATVRRAARSAAMASSSLLFDASNDDEASEGGKKKRRSSGNPLLDGILSGIQDVVDAVEALPSPTSDEERSFESPLFVVPKSLWGEASFPVEDGIAFANATSPDGNNTSSGVVGDESRRRSPIHIPVSIDDYDFADSGSPIIGSEAFVERAVVQRTIRRFAEHGIHQLAGISSSPVESDDEATLTPTIESVRSLFATDAEIVSFGSSTGIAAEERDCITLLRGAGKVADFYRSLALIREASGGKRSAFVVTDLDADVATRRLVVSWRTKSPIQIEGVDAFVFEAPSTSMSSKRLPVSGDGDKDEVAKLCRLYFGAEGDTDEIALKITRIENLHLTVAGVTADSTWAQSFVSAALRSGITTPLPDATIAELLRNLTSKKPPAKKAAPRKDLPKDSSMPALDDAAAVSFYSILRALHNDLPRIADTDSGSSAAVPADDFLAETVELRGLLGERIADGSRSYRRLVGVAISSLRAALQANAVRLAAKPRASVEVTAKGTIKVNLIVPLWVTGPQLPLAGGMGQPLKIEVSSEYIIDSAGRIREHVILESRLNGVLTPGDVFSRWIKGLSREDGGGSGNAAPSAIDSLVEAITWVKSMQERK